MTKIGRVVVSFEGVGRGKRSWTTEFPQFDARLLLKDIRSKGGLMSREVDVDWDDEAQRGTVLVGGFRPVGTFTITEPA